MSPFQISIRFKQVLLQQLDIHTLIITNFQLIILVWELTFQTADWRTLHKVIYILSVSRYWPLLMPFSSSQRTRMIQNFFFKKEQKTLLY